jgi:peroxiredoxin Q/BCP
MRLTLTTRFALMALIASAVPAARAQQPAAAPTLPVPEVGAMAPDFSLPGATRYGTLKEPVRLAEFRGKTVVLAFFYRARTKG